MLRACSDFGKCIIRRNFFTEKNKEAQRRSELSRLETGQESTIFSASDSDEKETWGSLSVSASTFGQRRKWFILGAVFCLSALFLGVYTNPKITAIGWAYDLYLFYKAFTVVCNTEVVNIMHGSDGKRQNLRRMPKHVVYTISMKPWYNCIFSYRNLKLNTLSSITGVTVQ